MIVQQSSPLMNTTYNWRLLKDNVRIEYLTVSTAESHGDVASDRQREMALGMKAYIHTKLRHLRTFSTVLSAVMSVLSQAPQAQNRSSLKIV